MRRDERESKEGRRAGNERNRRATRTVSTSSGEAPRTTGRMVRSTASKRVGERWGRARVGRERALRLCFYRGEGGDEMA
jgi:hypothetical protein